MISDEVYSELLFDGEHVSPASLPGMADRTATLNSLSKSHAMTGWRVGWVVGPAALCAHLENLALCMLYGSPEFIRMPPAPRWRRRCRSWRRCARPTAAAATW